MTDDRWIDIPRWNEFQHYKDRDPAWIKVYTRLLHDPQYLDLSLSQRGILHGLWLLCAKRRGVLHEAPTKHLLVTNKAESRHWRGNLEALNHAGFITFSASAPLAHGYQDASLEKEVRERRFTKNPKSARARDAAPSSQRSNVQPRDPAEAIRTMIANGAITDPVDLEAELAAAGLNGDTANQLRQLVAASANGADPDRIPADLINDTQPDQSDG